MGGTDDDAPIIVGAALVLSRVRPSRGQGPDSV